MAQQKLQSKPQQAKQAAVLSRKLIITAICLALVLVTAAVYSRCIDYGYVSYDDNVYVYENSHVQGGLSASGFVWAFTSLSNANWHPLTWLSYMLDCQLFGLNPGAQHAVNILWHLAAACLLFLALLRMTGAYWRSALVAGVFALHPLHVESVAWIAERKDVLCAFFEMLTLLLYARYVKHRNAANYLLVITAFALSLLAKPMAVTLPFLLLLLDYWPLRRIELSWKRLLWEKAPLFALTVLSSVLTFIAQHRFGALSALAHVPLGQRIADALVAYARYIVMAFWPENLAVLYPLARPSWYAVAGSALLLALITAIAVATRKRHPYLLFGWLWFVGALVPVIGIVQVGVQSMADRYTYIPLIGLSIALVWTIAAFVQNVPAARAAAASCGVLALVAFAATAYHQTGYWKNSKTLYEHALNVTPANPFIEHNLALVFASEGKHSEAAALFKKAVNELPDAALSHAHLGMELSKLGRFDEATDEFRTATRLDPNSADIEALFGAGMLLRGKLNDAFSHLMRATQLNPLSADDQSLLGAVLAQLGRLDEAREHLELALRLGPHSPSDSAKAQSLLGAILAQQGRFDEARLHLEIAVQLAPRSAPTWGNLCAVQQHLGNLQDAISSCNKALELDPNSAQARAGLERLGAAPNKPLTR